MQAAAGWLGVIAGAGVLIWSMVILTRANAGVRVPYWKGAAQTPGASIFARVLGVFLAVGGALLLAESLGRAATILVVVCFLPGIVMIALHNRRLKTTE